MAVTTTPRLGLKQYSSGADPHPTRTEFNAQQTQLETLVALAAQGTLAERPTAAKWGRLYFATDNSRIYWDTGSAWVEVSNVGGGGAGSSVVVGGAGAEGTSNRAARADHTHSLPLATSSVSGAMSAADKATLDGAKVAAVSGSLVVRDSAGRAQFGSPAASGDAANKSYVDAQVQTRAAASHTHGWADITGKPSTFDPSAHRHDWSEIDNAPSTMTPGAHTHNASDINAGTLNAARLPLASSSSAGAMSSALFNDIAAATSLATAGALVRRDSSSRIAVSSPSAATDAANKGYVDAQIDTRAAASHSHTWSSITDKPSTFAPSQHTHDWSEVTGKPSGLTSASSSDVPDTLVLRNYYGNFSVASPGAGSHAANKEYVDSKVASLDQLTYSNGDHWRVTSGYVGYWGGSGWKFAVDRVTGEIYIGTIPWGSVTGKPALNNHTHSAGDITSGVLRYGSVRGTEGVHDYAVSGSVPGTSYAVWVDGQGKFGRNTSSIRYKGAVEDADVNVDGVLALRPRTYIRRDEDGNLPENAPREFGMIAEEVDELLPDIVIRDSEGRVDGLRYDLLSVALVSTVQSLHERLQKLEGRDA